MKKLLILISCLFLIASCKNNKTLENKDVEEKTEMEQVPDMHTSEIALDWQGTYSGVLPCADCEGIKTEVILRDDSSYKIKRVYMNKDVTVVEESGNFKWTDDGGTVILTNNENGTTTLFKVGENHLRQLDMEGKLIDGDMTEMYVLQKN
ncbi:copper resistance protein NlpE [uncultured Planktosalinus sp.]|uniref:copper resistance protein NlpE n=1 Tax=uncultured Planktosalinus sp. TaxID=1810935 RepID=UPI0030DCC936